MPKHAMHRINLLCSPSKKNQTKTNKQKTKINKQKNPKNQKWTKKVTKNKREGGTN